jgi:chemotaxis response regulator CheB
MHQPLRCYVADADWLARHLVSDAIARDAGAAVIGVSSDERGVMRDIQALRPDALFVDARMNANMLNALLSHSAWCVVLVSAVAADAKRAHAHQAVDFVLRPCSRARIVVALDRVRKRMKERAARAS